MYPTKYEYICPRCGMTSISYPPNETHYCRFCKTELIETRYTSKDYVKHLDEGTLDDYKAKLFNEYVRDNPLYDPDEATRSYMKKQADKQRLDAQYRQERQAQENSKPHCPNCNSTDIQKIGTIERGVSVTAFGLFSGKIGKTMKCKKCGYKW